MRTSWKVLIIGAVAASSVTVLPVQAASAQAVDDPSANGTVVADGGDLPDGPLAVPPDLSDPTDTDDDGVTDAQETSGARNPWPGGFIGMAAPGDPTDPADPDSDDDGLSDGLEIGTDGGNRAGTGTDPNDADTDDDGVGDATEIASGTDARNPDTDLDQVDDGTEADLGTDPDVADSDFDGATDGAERAAGTDPLVSSVTGVEATGPFHFTDVPAGAYYEDAAYWATSDEVGALKRSPQFVPTGEVKRWKLAQILRNYATYLGRDTTAPPHSFSDIGALRRRARAAVSWATSNGIIPPTSASTFTPGRTITRAQLATALYRFARWAGDDAAATPADDPYTDTGTLNDTTRSAIGWLSLTGILADSGAIPSPTLFKPKKLVTRAVAVSLLFQLDEEVGTPQPTEDTDGDGITNFDEVQGIQNPYPEPTDGGDVDPLDPAGQCLSPEPATDLPPTADGSGAPTDPDDPDSDDDGMSDGRELTELQTDPNDADTDNDCVSDGDEIDGFPLVLDLDGQGCPGGGGGGCPDITRYTSHSDPLDEDTDDDELPDHEEVLIRTDPELADTDLDGIDDYQEWNRWFTAPTSVDSDRDSRGSEGDQPPTPSLFDGLELRDTGTSPTLADTDGDGTTDFDEFDSPIRSMTVAELPGFSMDFVGGTSVRLVKERSQDQGGAIEVGISDSVSNATSTSETNSVTQSESNSLSVEAGFETTVQIGTEESFASATLSLTLGYAHEWGTERTREFSREESQEISQERSRTQSEEWTTSEAAVGGEISQGMRFTNTGTFTYQLSDIGYTLYLRNPDTLEEEVVGTMTIPLDGIVLPPGASTAPIQAVAEDVNVDLVEQFLASPSSMRFATGNIEFLDSDGRNFEFVQESTFGQTAQVVLDFGSQGPGDPGRFEDYTVATNVARDDIDGDFNDISLYPGVHLGSPPPDSPAWMAGVMDQIGYPRCEDDTPAAGCYTTTPDGRLASVDGVANADAGSAGPDLCPGQWGIMTSSDEQTEQALTEGFDDVIVHAGDRIRIVRQTDCDQDELLDSVEPVVNADVGPSDTDGDGISDFEEARGWIVALADPDNAGQPCAADPVPGTPLWEADSDACPWAAPNPKIADTDGDGVGDAEERDGAGRDFNGAPVDARANPLERDSDGDRMSDCATAGAGCDGLAPDPAPLNSAVRYVDPTPCNTDGCWVNPYSSLTSALNITGINANPDPRDDVRSVWVAGGTYQAPVTGFALPTQAGVFGGFRGDERRIDQRVLAFTGPTATRLTGQGNLMQDAVVRLDEDFSTIDGFLIQGGGRGGVRGSGDHATLSNLEVSNNSAPAQSATVGADGGGITWHDSQDLTIRRVTVASNQGPAGGIAFHRVPEAHVAFSTVRNNLSNGDLHRLSCNTTPARQCSGGGGVFVDDSTVAFDDSAIEDNTALVGGGIDAVGALTTLKVRNTSVTGNTAQGDATVVGRGGGVHVHGFARALLAGCLLADNSTRVGPRWYNAAADGFGGGLFAHDFADVRMINCTVSGNDGAGVIVAGAEEGRMSSGAGGYSSTSNGFSFGADAIVQSSIFVGNTMDWQPTYVSRLGDTLGSQARPSLFGQLDDVGLGLLGFNDEWNVGGDIGKYRACLGGTGPLAPVEDNNCGYAWFTGIATSSSSELRTGGSPESVSSNGPTVIAEDSMVGTGSVHGSFGDFCGGFEYFGRTESPTSNNNRGSVVCDGGTKNDRYLGLRGRGFQGQAIRSLAAPANVDDLFSFPGYSLLPGTNAVNRGNQDVDWDPYLDGIQDPPETDLSGNPRVVGRRIDLGAFELQ